MIGYESPFYVKMVLHFTLYDGDTVEDADDDGDDGGDGDI